VEHVYSSFLFDLAHRILFRRATRFAFKDSGLGG